ncbi:hypothetical protein VE03_10658 [Pseudogymnoascus sp. 23342-1-I1]|nr:hypothetical protein VE03_10658 [Pseudogymnoascus sp. 23342-1-I1]
MLKLAGVRPSEAVISMIRDAQVQFMENTGRTVRITFFAPTWDKPNMEKLRPPPLDRVLKGKQEYENAQRRMAAAIDGGEGEGDHDDDDDDSASSSQGKEGSA